LPGGKITRVLNYKKQATRVNGQSSGDLSDEACSDLPPSSSELTKSEAAFQDSLARRARLLHQNVISTEGAFQGRPEHGFDTSEFRQQMEWRHGHLALKHAFSADHLSMPVPSPTG
jgi:hypothetical protein